MVIPPSGLNGHYGPASGNVNGHNIAQMGLEGPLLPPDVMAQALNQLWVLYLAERERTGTRGGFGAGAGRGGRGGRRVGGGSGPATAVKKSRRGGKKGGH
jgi:hypothetical protein